MWRGLSLFLILTAGILTANDQLLPPIPNAPSTHAIQLDSAGNIYVAGSFVPAGKNYFAAFVAKLSPDASQVLYFTPLAGTTGNNVANALSIGPDGSVYTGGYTFASDFPVTAGAMQTTFTGGEQGFFAKLNPAGSIAYATFVTGLASTSVTGIALDSAGDVFLTGAGGPGISSNTQPFASFVMELNPALTQVLLETDGYGGGFIALDSQHNIYLSGTAQPVESNGTLTLPTLAGAAFQPGHTARLCFVSGDSGPGVGGIGVPCQYQYVAKLAATGKPLWATYLTGTYGASTAGMSVDSAGNVTVAGTTYSDDYPVTAGAFQTAYTAAQPQLPPTPGSTLFAPPAATGFVTRINSTGSALLWSTYFGGSYADAITGMTVSATGQIFLSGHADSRDLPALADTPEACRPTPNQILGFVTRMSSDGATAGPTHLVEGAPDCLFFTCAAILYDDYPNYPAFGPVALRADGTSLFAGPNGTLAAIDFSSTTRLRCVVDPTDYVPLTTVAPGQLLSLFGSDLAPATPFLPSAGTAASTATFGVFFNGIGAPILYSGGQQINVQVPYEIGGQSTVQMQVIDKQTTLPLSETITLGVVQRQPAIFLAPAALLSLFPGNTSCGGVLAFGVAALALNADGSLNDCTNPAAAGSVVTLFVDGAGPVTPALSTGAISAAPPVSLTPGFAAADANGSPIPVGTLTLPGSISAVSQLQFQLPQSLTAGPYTLGPIVNGTASRERSVIVWTRPK